MNHRRLSSVQVIQFTTWKKPTYCFSNGYQAQEGLSLLSKNDCLLDCDSFYHCSNPSSFLHESILPVAAIVYLTSSVVAG